MSCESFQPDRPNIIRQTDNAQDTMQSTEQFEQTVFALGKVREFLEKTNSPLLPEYMMDKTQHE